MYGLDAGYANSALANQIAIKSSYEEMTVGENIERKIAEKKQQLAHLESALVQMKEANLHNVKISLLQAAMSF